MIEKLLKNDLYLKRYRRFKRKKLAVISLIALVILCFFSFTAEFWANSKPIALRYNQHWYFPILKTYSAKDFQISDELTVNYKKITLDEGRGDHAFWPIIRWDPYESNDTVESFPGAPTYQNLLGTDDRGRDVLTRLLYGFRYSITYAALVWVISYAVGISLGGVMGYFGGKLDFIGQRIVEVMSTIPTLFLLIILISIFEPGLTLLVCITSIFGWIGISYYVRAEFLKNRKREFVEAARALGAGHARIIFGHILPNSLGPVITYSPFFIAANISSLAMLDYLGFGLTPPTPSWGELLNQAHHYFTIGWWLAFYPSMALFGALVLLTLLGEGVRDAMDPNMT